MQTVTRCTRANRISKPQQPVFFARSLAMRIDAALPLVGMRWSQPGTGLVGYRSNDLAINEEPTGIPLRT
jgi:hypothetical protein